MPVAADLLIRMALIFRVICQDQEVEGRISSDHPICPGDQEAVRTLMIRI